MEDMKELFPPIDPLADEQEGLRHSDYPCFSKFCRSQGRFRIPEQGFLSRSLEAGLALENARNNAILRLDMSMACLWPFLEQFFNFQLFPSRLAAALHLLRAASFAREEDPDPRIPALAQELQEALDDLEALLCREETAATKQDGAEPQSPASATADKFSSAAEPEAGKLDKQQKLSQK